MIYTMIIAWILTWFNLDNLIIDGINQIFNTDYTIALYWLLFFIIGIIVSLISRIKK